jgi:hypothetical protein
MHLISLPINYVSLHILMQYYKVICKVSELGTKIAKFGKNKQSNDKSKENLKMMKNWGVKLAFAPKLGNPKFGS